MARLPVPGGDENQWGDVLNEFLSQSHNADGTLKQTAISDAGGFVSDALPGYELAVAQKGDAQFITSSTTAVDIPGLSITFTVPTRPYVVKFVAVAAVEEVGAAGSITIYETTAAKVVGYANVVKAHANLGAQSVIFELRVPGTFHSPTPGSTVTYKLQAQSSVGTSDFTIYAGDLGGFGQWNATLVALIQ